MPDFCTKSIVAFFQGLKSSTAWSIPKDTKRLYLNAYLSMGDQTARKNLLHSSVLQSAQTRLHAPVATHCPYCAFQQLQAQYGNDAVDVFGGGSPTNEKAYLLGKFAGVALATSQIDDNGRFCLSSSVFRKGKHMKGKCKYCYA